MKFKENDCGKSAEVYRSRKQWDWTAYRRQQSDTLYERSSVVLEIAVVCTAYGTENRLQYGRVADSNRAIQISSSACST
jgi:hypothetical protein